MRTGVDKTTYKGTDEERAQLLQNARDSIADAFSYLTSYKEQNFNARTLNLLDRIAVPNYGTMGVTSHKGKYLLIYDPLFATRISADELRATCEHEVVHIILEHLPRMIMLWRLFDDDDLREKAIAKMVANLAADMAANEYVALSWPAIKDPKKPLGYWVTPEGYEPPFPNDRAFEEYFRMLFDHFKEKLDKTPEELQKIAQQLCNQTKKALMQALQQLAQDNAGNEGEEDDGGEGSESEDGEGDEDGDGTPQGSGGKGGSQKGKSKPKSGAGNGGNGDTDSDTEQEEKEQEELQNALDQLSDGDAEFVKALANAMRPHMAWEETTSGDEGEAHKLAEHGKSIIKQSLHSQQKSRGTVPGHLKQLIKAMLTPPTVAWTELLHNIVQRTRQTKKIRGMSRPSKILAAIKTYAKNHDEEDPTDIRLKLYAQTRRLPVFPGARHSRKFTIAYIVDTSGSMSTADLQLGLSELQHIQRADPDIRICVMYIDMSIGKEYWITPSDTIDEEMTGRGGTDFETAFLRVKELLRTQDNAPDIMVYCTDGYAPKPVTKLPIPTVWLIVPNGQPIMTEAGHITIQMKNYQMEDADV